MAKLLLSLALLSVPFAFFVSSGFSKTTYVKPEVPDVSFGNGTKVLDALFNPLVNQLLQSAFHFASNLTSQIDESLGTSGLRPEVSSQLSSILNLINLQARSIKLSYSFFMTAILLWPLALLAGPLGCCLACSGCCPIGCLTLGIALVAILLYILIFHPFSGLEAEATQTLLTLVDSLGVVTTETLNSVALMAQSGITAQAGLVLATVQSGVSIFSAFAGTLEALLSHPQMTVSLAEEVTTVYGAVLEILQALDGQTHAIMKNLPVEAAQINGTLKVLVEHIEETLARLVAN